VPPGGDQPLVLGEIGGQEDDQHNLGDLRALHVDRAEADAQPRAVLLLADEHRQHHQRERRHQPGVLVAPQPVQPLDDGTDADDEGEPGREEDQLLR
jgi:hypothetical protein